MEKWTFFAKMLHIYFYSALRQRLLLSLSFSHFSIISPSQSLSLSHFSTFSLSIFLFLTWEHYLFASLLSLTLYIYFSHLSTQLSLSLSSFPHSHHTVASFSFFQNQAQCGKKVDRRQCSKDFTFKLQPFFPSLFHFLIWLFHCLSFSKPFFFHFLSAIPYLHHHSTIHKTNYQSRYIVD